MKNLKAKFWQYTGNSDAGHDCPRQDPHGFGIELISFLAYRAEHKVFASSLTEEDLNLVIVKRHNKTQSSFGIEITVAAPAEIWEKAAMALEAEKHPSAVAR